MVAVISRRLAIAIPVLIVVSFLIFLLESLVPGNPAQTILGQNATPANVAALTKQLGLDKPLFTSYWDWLREVAQGHLGTSIFTGQSVASELNQRLPVTLSLVGLSVVVSAAVGVTVGLVSATRGGLLARVLDVTSLAGLALPSFWIAVVLVALFAVKLRIFPSEGYTSFGSSPLQWIEHLVLPVAALSLLGVTAVARQARDSILDALDADFVVMLTANGLPRRRVLWLHVLRNASLPVVTVLGVVAAGMLGGAVFIENVFVLPGLGSLATQSTLDHDLPTILGVGLYFTVLVVIINLLVDVASVLLNPRVRVG